MFIRVQYQDDRYDYIADFMLDNYVSSKEVKRFYRPSEERWVYTANDPVRGLGGTYAGPERRKAYMPATAN
jgi:hypothetical protein